MTDCVLIGGVFDPLHAGHLAYIRTAKALGGMLICAVSDDETKHPPLVPIAERARLLEALGCDHVFTARGSDRLGHIESLIATYRPRAYVKGIDWTGKLPQTQVAQCEATGTEIVYTDTIRQSSSRLLACYEQRRNADKLAAFEAFVQAQKPADKPWEPVTDYSYEGRLKIEAPHAELIKATFNPAKVLDVGCGPGHLMGLLMSLGVKCRGVDVAADPNWKAEDRVWRYDIAGPSGPDWFDGLERDYLVADLVICREVLEHLTVRQIAVAVRNLVRLSSKYVYVTTRFSGGSHLLDVDGLDDLDPTHISMLNQDYLRSLFVLEGCRRRADLETALDWKHYGRVLVYEVPA